MRGQQLPGGTVIARRHRHRRRVARGLTAAAVTTGLVAGAAVAQAAAPPTLGGLHDARYCEIIELKGAPPAAIATVWNTIGLNRCPAAQWDPLDAGALAKELGDTMVVLNGPRHFLMDSASATPGVTRTFHGLKMRRAAAIKITAADDLIRRPYVDRVITRSNRWHWKAGRTVFELVAPGGDTYVMQSYSQIVDRSLTLARLPALGKRLALPAGWRYRTRRLTRPLTLSAKGAATITQDELQNTYQLASTKRHGRRTTHRVAITGTTATVPATTPGTVEDHGTVDGTPFGKGSLVLVGTLGDGHLTATVRLTFPRGSILVSAVLPFTISGNEIDFNGTSRVVGGTGAFRGIVGGALATHDHNTLDGQHGVLTVSGTVTY